MVFSSPTVTEALTETGQRLRRLRLDAGLSQAQLAAKAGVSLTALQKLEAGAGSTLSTYIRVLKALGLLSTLDTLAPLPEISPLDMLKMKARRQRQRAPRSKS